MQVRLESEMAGLQLAISLQTGRRATTDGALYRLCEQCDRLMEPGPKSEEANRLLTRVSKFRGRSASARMTAQIIHCHYRKVDKIRRIRRDGTPQIQEDVRNDKMSINKAYNQMREIEKTEENRGESSSPAHVRPLKIRFSAEAFAILEQLGGDLGTQVNKAVEMYIRWLQDKERV